VPQNFAEIAGQRFFGKLNGSGGALGHPQVQIAHDVLLYAQKRDPLKLRTLYPTNAAEAAPPAPLGGHG